MAEIFRLPAVSPTMEVGTIEGWTVAEGEAFASGDALVEVGTDKATIDAQIFEEGVLLAQLVDEGDEVPVNAPIAIVGEEGEDIDELRADAEAELKQMREGGASSEDADDEGDGDGGKAKEAEDAEDTDDDAEDTDDDAGDTDDDAGDGERDTPDGSGDDARSERPDTADTPSPTRSWHDIELPPVFLDPPGDIAAAGGGGAAPSSGTDARVLASPLARKMAEDKGVDLRRLSGSGPHGRIVAADVEDAEAGAAPSEAPREDRTVKLTPMRRTIAKRLTEVHTTVPVFYLNVTFDMTAMVALRGHLKDAHPDAKVSYNDLLVWACARALADFPRANASWTDKGIVEHGSVDIGVAVAVEDGLLTPVIRGAHRLGFEDIASRTRALAGKARDGTLDAEDYTGNTFTISNLGMFGIDHFTAILNPPASAILAVGALGQVPVVEHGELTAGWRMTATMTCDHRVIDGATGARFLQVLRRYVEAPALALM